MRGGTRPGGARRRAVPAREDAAPDRDELPAISYVWQTPNRRPRRSAMDGAGGVVQGGQGGSRPLTPAMRAKLERIVSRAPEVMVKITGRTKDVGHLHAHLEYITRKGDLAAETETGTVMHGRPGLRDLQALWADDVLLDERRANRTLSVNMILSMPPGTDSIAVRDAVRAFAIETFEGRHDYAFVLHQDDTHPHVHLTVRSCGHDGRRLNPRKADLAEWRERFADELRRRGVAAEATPRRTRGRTLKADRGPIRAMKERGVQPRVERAAREEVVREAQRGAGPATGAAADERPWEEKTRARQREIRARYAALVQNLRSTHRAEDVTLADKVEAFVRELPALETRRHALRRELAELGAAAGRDGPVRAIGSKPDLDRKPAPSRPGRDDERGR